MSVDRSQAMARGRWVAHGALLGLLAALGAALLTPVVGLAQPSAPRDPGRSRPVAFGLAYEPAAANGRLVLPPVGGARLRSFTASTGVPPAVRHRVLPPSPRSRGEVLVLAGAVMPAIALRAYEHAATLMAASDAGCGLRWPMLAGIGRIESDNGQTNGSAARVTRNGTLSPPILGPPLNGASGNELIRATPYDTSLTGDRVWDRAVGPMQFLPETWQTYGQDGTGDGVKNPENYFDADLAAAVYLCAGGGDLDRARQLAAALFSYNDSAAYVAVVLRWIAFYERVSPAAIIDAAGLAPSHHHVKPKRGHRRPAAHPRPTGTTSPPTTAPPTTTAPTTTQPGRTTTTSCSTTTTRRSGTTTTRRSGTTSSTTTTSTTLPCG